MVKKVNEIPGWGLMAAALLLSLPMATVWGTEEMDKKDVEIATALSIPTLAAQVEPWFQKAIRPAKERKDLDPSLVTAEAKLEVITVRKDGSGKFKTIMDAVNAVEVKGNDNRVVIDIGPGVYQEKIKIDRYRPYITLYGDPKNPPVVEFGDIPGPKVEDMDTATLSVDGDYFQACNLYISNIGALKKNLTAIALRVTGNYASFYNCRISGYKSTILDDKGAHFFKDCYIQGGDDIIFGDGLSIYLNTTIHVLPFAPVSIITAQARKNTIDGNGGGFIFAHGKVDGEQTTEALLGRTYMAGSRVFFAFMDLSSVIQPKGWFDNFDTDYEKTATFLELMNYGRGAPLTKRIKQPCTQPPNREQILTYLNLVFINAPTWLLPPPQLNAADSKAEPKAEAKGEAKAEPKAEAKGEPKAEAKGEAKAEPKAEAKGEAKAEPKAEAKGEAKAESKGEPKAEAKGEAKAEPKAGAKAESKGEPKAEAKAEAKPAH